MRVRVRVSDNFIEFCLSLLCLFHLIDGLLDDYMMTILSLMLVH